MTDTETVDPASTDDENEADRGPRGASFPTMDLTAAIAVIHKAGGHGADFTTAAFAQYCGHSTANSGPFRTKLAAFRDWGLVTTQAGRVQLTALGKDVARSAEPTSDNALLRRAFDTCKIFKRFYDDQAKGTPLKRDVLGRVAMLDHKVASKSQDKFVTAFVESAVAVGLASADAETGTITLVSASSLAETRSQSDVPHGGRSETSAGADPVSVAPSSPSNAHGAPSATIGAPLVLRQAWPTATGEVVLEIRSTEPLAASAFALVGKAVEAAVTLAASIGPSETVAGVSGDRERAEDAQSEGPEEGDAA